MTRASFTLACACFEGNAVLLRDQASGRVPLDKFHGDRSGHDVIASRYNVMVMTIIDRDRLDRRRTLSRSRALIALVFLSSCLRIYLPRVSSTTFVGNVIYRNFFISYENIGIFFFFARLQNKWEHCLQFSTRKNVELEYWTEPLIF